MKLKNILLEKMPGGVKAKMIELSTDELGWWKFTLRLTDPILQNTTMKWGYVTTALNSKDFETKKVTTNFPQFKQQVLDNVKDWVFATNRAPRKRTYGIRQVIEVEVDVIPRETEQLKKPIDRKNPVKEKVVLNTRKMRLLDKVRNVELYEMPGEYPYEPIKTAPAETGDKEKIAAETTNAITYDPAKSNIVQKNVQQFQQLIIDKLGSKLKLASVPEYNKFLRVGGADGQYGSATKNLIDFLEDHYKVTRTNGTKITPELQQKIKAGLT